MSILKLVKSLMPDCNAYIDESSSVKSSTASHVGLNVPEVMMTYGGGIHMSLKESAVIGPKIVGSLFEARKSYKTLKNNPKEHKTVIDSETLEELKTYAQKFGIEDLGFAKVEAGMIFKNKKILFNDAIVFLMEMKKEAINLAPSFETHDEVFRAYYALGKTVNALAEFLRKKGYRVQAAPALNGDVCYPVLAEAAGLGAMGKHGLLINPKYGPSLRIGALYIDVENLPINEVNEHLWIREFCNKCNQCVRKCLGSAIYKESITCADGSKKCIDYKKCAEPFSQQDGCSVCIKECTFFKGDYSKIKSKVNM